MQLVRTLRALHPPRPRFSDPQPASFAGSGGVALRADRLGWEEDGHRILNTISLMAEPGDIIGIIGPNGAGKSSLLRLLYRFVQPTTGSVRIDREDIWAISAAAFARKVAVVLQEFPADFGLRACEVVETGRIPHQSGWAASNRRDREIVFDAMETVGVRALADRDFASLSGGEKQRVLLARAIAQQPELLILDEPTNHLDIGYQFECLRLVRDLPMTVIASIHDLNIAATYCDRLYCLDHGRMVASGNPDDVLTPDLIRKVYGVNALCDTHPFTGRLRITFDPN
ncbi:ABC transporter ATP-binding protein [Thalassospira sp.]|uniref:ABC transporter ATP-binding protein n=1 Tax=Thalassospira sp. TaxID=1912094 RepID=UPI0027323CA3|nr:ABC transporter ATP-binding protein [Thalassospira sp.]MDP2700226.1 ABC transporter ATP-binding protein [Thalassospira sp.]